MKFIVYGRSWAGGMKIKPIDILHKYCRNTITIFPETENTAECYELDITSDELMAMAESNEFDIMISANNNPPLLSFDELGKMFRQR